MKSFKDFSAPKAVAGENAISAPIWRYFMGLCELMADISCDLSRHGRRTGHLWPYGFVYAEIVIKREI